MRNAAQIEACEREIKSRAEELRKRFKTVEAKGFPKAESEHLERDLKILQADSEQLKRDKEIATASRKMMDKMQGSGGDLARKTAARGDVPAGALSNLTPKDLSDKNRHPMWQRLRIRDRGLLRGTD